MEPEKNVDPPALHVFPGDWDSYETSLHEIFSSTLLAGDLRFLGLRVMMQRRPEYKNKHFTFWHLISEGPEEDNRLPDFRRCERLSWIRWVIENAGSHPDISFWENKRQRSKNIVIWYEKGSYAVVVARRNGYFLLKTAYVVSSRRARVFGVEREQYRKSNS